MYLAFETLPAELKRAIAGKSCKHDSSRNSVGELRKGFKEVTDPREAPGAVHPIIRTHPATRRNPSSLAGGATPLTRFRAG